ncbi:MAG: hypothetical protein AVO33_07325 [delta proteobacterium ML8_F1]|nr:MAG: hypothetical protein AVO33_07325 [delta proteobacterium ML8_F1]
MEFKKTAANILALVNVAIFAVIFSMDPSVSTYTLIGWGAKSNFSIADLELFRLVTPMFLHVTFYHLLFNTFALYIIGNQIEALLGKKKFLFLYFGSGILATMGSFITNNYVSAGASGGIFGLLGAHIFLFLYNKETYRRFFGNDFLFLIAINIFYGFVNPNIDNAGHLFGLLGGILISFLIGRKIPSFKINQKLIGTLGILLLTLAFGLRIADYRNSEDYYYSKTLYLITRQSYEEAYDTISRGMETNPQSKALQDLFNAFEVN